MITHLSFDFSNCLLITIMMIECYHLWSYERFQVKNYTDFTCTLWEVTMHTKCTCKTKNSLQNHLDAYLQVGIFIPSKEMFHSNVGICSVVNGYNIKKIKHKPFVKTEFTKENFCYSYIILHKCIYMYSTK